MCGEAALPSGLSEWNRAVRRYSDRGALPIVKSRRKLIGLRDSKSRSRKLAVCDVVGLVNLSST